jgi:hypothetical protein
MAAKTASLRLNKFKYFKYLYEQSSSRTRASILSTAIYKSYANHAEHILAIVISLYRPGELRCEKVAAIVTGLSCVARRSNCSFV